MKKKYKDAEEKHLNIVLFKKVANSKRFIHRLVELLFDSD